MALGIHKLGDYPVTINRTKWVPTEDGLGNKSVPDGQETVTVMVTVDMDDILSICRKAARSKGGRSQSGPIVAKVATKRRR